MSKTLLIVIGLLAAMITAAGIMHYTDIYRKAEKPNICELVLRTQFERNASYPGVYCIEIDGKDPSDEFLARFKGHQPPVKKGSEFILGQDLKFSVYNFKWLNNWTVEVGGDFSWEGLDGSGCTYHIIRKNGRWTIKRTFNHWIS